MQQATGGWRSLDILGAKNPRNFKLLNICRLVTVFRAHGREDVDWKGGESATKSADKQLASRAESARECHDTPLAVRAAALLVLPSPRLGSLSDRPELIMLHHSDDSDALLLVGSSRLQVHTHSSLRSTVTATLVKLSEAHARRSGRLSGMSKCQALKPRKARSAGLEHRLAYTNIRRLIELSW